MFLSDDHQRILLIAQVQLPITKTIVTIATSHWSLFPVSRDKAVEKVFEVFASQRLLPSNVQIFTGDLNAEPHESSIQSLLRSAQQPVSQISLLLFLDCHYLKLMQSY